MNGYWKGEDEDWFYQVRQRQVKQQTLEGTVKDGILRTVRELAHINGGNPVKPLSVICRYVASSDFQQLAEAHGDELVCYHFAAALERLHKDGAITLDSGRIRIA